MAAAGTPRLSTYSTPATPANRSLSVAPTASKAPAGTAAAAAAANALQQQAPPPLPPPATFDILPHLHTLLNRLLIQKPSDAQQQAGDDGSSSSNSKPSDDTAATNTNTCKPSTDGAGVGAASGATGVPPSASSSSAADPPDSQPLEIHQLAAASSALKVRLQRARQACARLGDVDRTVEEQREEIAELEERVAKLRAVLEDMGVAPAAAGDARMAVAPAGGGDGAH
ncbi:hypothetical protein MPH_10658 [Macrophomina phaseolina MS6]|uniref:Mediator of RNA polymerase II transcription subunit 9 n=2 Tax=Macrophomina phaseolina TaxID=35725 RepID=K2S640_MACPH|nr:hypothetical protein MPH_10658 [Macrophomina phaseolina MS6]KAH7055804.1 RNA polymerase II transcription mediator complex subunit 9-domain-containing protein [Macrophomina phaseolina]